MAVLGFVFLLEVILVTAGICVGYLIFSWTLFMMSDAEAF